MSANSATYATIGAWIKQRRAALGLTQLQLASKSNCSLSVIRRLERNDYAPSQEIIDCLAKALEIARDDLECFSKLAQEGNSHDILTVLEEAISSKPTGDPLPTPSTPNNSVTPITQPALVPASSLQPRWALWVGLCLVLLAVIGLFSWLLNKPGHPKVGQINLVPMSGELITIKDQANRDLRNGDVIALMQTITVTFQIQNFERYPITIQTLEIGVRGPNAKKLNWGAPARHFVNVRELVLPAGQHYIYTSSMTFTTPGDYFIEPVMQNVLGDWGGIEPFTRLWFEVR